MVAAIIIGFLARIIAVAGRINLAKVIARSECQSQSYGMSQIGYLGAALFNAEKFENLTVHLAEVELS